MHACRRHRREAEPKPMAGQERGGEVSNEFFQQRLTVKLKNIVPFSLIIAEIK